MGRRSNNMRIFRDTKAAMRVGGYAYGDQHVSLPGTADEWREVRVFHADEVVDLVEHPSYQTVFRLGACCNVEVVNQDSLTAAGELAANGTGTLPPLVLNFANPVEPGGGVTRGASAQEEDLCRRSTLYLSLNSVAAEPYYCENAAAHPGLFTHNALLSPHVQVFRTSDGTYLEQPFEVAVLTVAAPFVPATVAVSSKDLRATIKMRIMGMLQIAASCGYRRLVLGAWGCGVFGNDPEQVSTCFREALHEIRSGREGDPTQGADVNSLFSKVLFAVPGPSHNHEVFARVLVDFHREEDERELEGVERLRREKELDLGAFEGCLVGGAVGDALGYPVEFMSRASILNTFGPAGIRGYWLEETGGVALFSDDTQMTLFTAAGLLVGHTRGCLRGIVGEPKGYIYYSYLDWLHTQDRSFTNRRETWLADVKELYSRRAPGSTCLSALRSGEMGTMEEPLNDSKGCGGVMRVAPIGLFAKNWFGGIDTPEKLARIARAGAAAAAITHGHPMGYIPSGALAVLVALCAFDKDHSLAEKVERVAELLPSWFERDEAYARDMARQLRLAAELAAGDEGDHACIVQLGEGWVGDEALAISVFCCLRHPESFDEAVIAAVNHSGDSDSTGAIAGNIMGAELGIDAIGEQWTGDLELRKVLMTVARDLCDGCLMSEVGHYRDELWFAKYTGSGQGSLEVEDLLRKDLA